MYIIAGLPPAVAIRTAHSLNKHAEKDLQRALYHVPAFSEADHNLYISEDYSKIRRNIASIIMDNISEGKKKPGAPMVTPSRIFLLFVPWFNREEKLLKEFEFFVYPVKVSQPTEHNQRWRHNPSLALSAVESCIRQIKEFAPDFLFVSNEIKQRLPMTPLALPPTNFVTAHP